MTAHIDPDLHRAAAGQGTPDWQFVIDNPWGTD